MREYVSADNPTTENTFRMSSTSFSEIHIVKDGSVTKVIMRGLHFLTVAFKNECFCAERVFSDASYLLYFPSFPMRFENRS